RFAALETALNKAGDQIEGAAKQQALKARFYQQMAIIAAIIASLLGLAAGAMLVWSALGVTLRPLRQLQQAMQRLASGDHKGMVPYQERLDEVGNMAQAIEVFRLSAVELAKLEQAMRTARDKERRHDAHLQEQVTAFKGQVSQVLDALT